MIHFRRVFAPYIAPLGYSQDFTDGTSFHIAVGLLLFVVDMLLRLVLRKEAVRRWYYVHFFGNAIVCSYALGPMLQLLSDPMNEIREPHYFSESAWVITVIHVYHLIAYKCRPDEWMHHIVFVLVGTATQYIVNWGRITALYHFFICGLPGGLDYLALGLSKDGVISKDVRLRCAVELNMWVRAPFIIVAWAFAWIWYTISVRDWTHFLCFIAITIASVINAQFYSRQVVLAGGKTLRIA